MSYMTTALASLDAFIDGPTNRDVTRCTQLLLYASSYEEHVLVFGDGDAASAALSALVRFYPATNARIGIVEKRTGGVCFGITPLSDTLTEARGITIAESLRALLRQDPDVLAVAYPDAECADIIIQAALTGHRALISVPNGTLEEASEAWNEMAKLTQESQFFQFGSAIEVQRNAEGNPRIAKVFRRIGDSFVAVVEVKDSVVKIDRSIVPDIPLPRSPRYTPTWAPSITDRPRAMVLPREAYIPITTVNALGRTTIGARSALLPHGSSWPTCARCAAAMTNIVQLDFTELPEPYRKDGGIVQLFLCPNGGEQQCWIESGGGIGLYLYQDVSNLEELPAPQEVPACALGGAITQWRKIVEEPFPHEAVLGTELDMQQYSDAQEKALPIECDKLGGWPAWIQDFDWPKNDDGTTMTLLMQLAEGGERMGGETEGWNYERAEIISATEGEFVQDPNFPRHNASSMTGEAMLYLFIDTTGTRLAFWWQTG